MSFDVKFYSFSKKVNSTKQPSGSAGTTFSCNLKEETSILNPTIILNTSSSDVIGYNYAYISSFNRYYFIKDVRATSRNIWEIDMSCDVMATYKTGIGSMTPYVLRSASQSDEYILDEVYPADSYITEFISNPIAGTIEYPSADAPFSFRTSYSYVLGIIGAANGGIGSVTYYQMNQVQLNSFMNYLFGSTSLWSDISTSDYSDGVQRALLNPMQYIVSCIMLPIDHTNISLDDDIIYFGTYEYEGTNVAKKLISEAGTIVVQKSSIMLLPSHPQASTRGKYLNGAPYSKYWLHLGPYGEIPLNGNLGDLITADALDNDRYITANMVFDLSSGICEVIVYPGKVALVPFGPNAGHNTASTKKRLATISLQAGVPIQLSSSYTDPIAVQEAGINIASGLIGSAAGLVTNPVGSVVGGALSLGSGLGSLFRASYPNVASNGSNGSAIQGYLVDEGIYIRSEHNRIVPENNTDLGRPLCQTKTLNTLSGFILCSNADFGGAGTSDERDQINNYLNTGFFYE